jgi:hypothetical protein
MKYLDVSDELGSDEESGKSWSELEEEARKGNEYFLIFLTSIDLISFLADAEKEDYDSDNGGRNKKKSGHSSKKRSTVVTKKRPARSPPPTNNKKRKR